MKNKVKLIAAFQGECGAFSHAAARKLLGEQVRVLPQIRFRETFQAVADGEATHAVIPIENTLHGSIHENYDNLQEFGLHIIGEVSIRIAHCLISMPGTPRRQVRTVFSHPVALNQCLKFFADHPQIERASFYDTAGSVKMLRDERPQHAAAIASEMAAEIYGGVILQRHLEDDRQNFTRFFLLSKQQSNREQRGQAWKTTLVFAIANKPGALFKVMACFALRDVNLSKIESRPMRGKPWEYLFYLDLGGHQDEERVQKAIDNLRELTSSLQILGSYQATV